jgi:hypothetical protein
MTVQVPEDKHDEKLAERNFLLSMAIIFMLVLGLMMLMFSLAYLNDLQTLQNLPDMIWSFVCGRPVENGVTLPLLLTFSMVSFLGSGLLYATKRWMS